MWITQHQRICTCKCLCGVEPARIFDFLFKFIYIAVNSACWKRSCSASQEKSRGIAGTLNSVFFILILVVGKTNMIKFLPYFVTLGMLNGQDLASVPPSVGEAVNVIQGTTGPFKTVYAWKQMDFQYPTAAAKSAAVASGDFIQENNLPLGMEVHKDRMFLSFPKWKNGVPASLAVVPKTRKGNNISPVMVPYPSWDWHNTSRYHQ